MKRRISTQGASHFALLWQTDLSLKYNYHLYLQILCYINYKMTYIQYTILYALCSEHKKCKGEYILMRSIENGIVVQTERSLK